MLAQLRAKGADVAKDVQEHDGVWCFGWVTDPEGNRVELWHPAKGAGQQKVSRRSAVSAPKRRESDRETRVPLRCQPT